MDAETIRARAYRCRELLRGNLRDDVREQLRQWAVEFDDEADELERGRRPAEYLATSPTRATRRSRCGLARCAVPGCSAILRISSLVLQWRHRTGIATPGTV